jgi:hypothetical protein
MVAGTKKAYPKPDRFKEADQLHFISFNRVTRSTRSSAK